MAWLATDKDRKEFIYSGKPYRDGNVWYGGHHGIICLPKGMIRKIIGRDLAWEDEPIELVDIDNDIV